MLILGQKGANLDQKGPKMGGTRFFPVLSLGYFINRPKMQFKYVKIKKILWPDFEKLAEALIFGQKWPFLTKIGQKRPNGIFRAKSENVTSVALGSPNFVPNLRKFLWTDSEISE